MRDSVLEQSSLDSFPGRPFYELTKRLLEVTVALAVLILFSPLWLAVALAIKLTSDGPIFFTGKVIGRGGREFTYYKFRSMYHNNDDSSHKNFIASYVSHHLHQNSPEPPSFKLLGDNRVTKVGKIIRKLSIDEVPQMFNVLRGEMAIVGPRPPVPYEYEKYDDWCRQRLTVTPGITGLAQVRARGKCSFREMVEIDLEYIHSRGIGLDLKIMLKTPMVMLKGV